MVLGTCFGLARMKNGGFGVKGIKLGPFTSRQLSLLSRVVKPFTSRQPCNLFKESQLFSFEQFL